MRCTVAKATCHAHPWAYSWLTHEGTGTGGVEGWLAELKERLEGGGLADSPVEPFDC